MVKNPAHDTFKPKYSLDNKILQILNDITLLLITSNSKERKQISMMLNLAAQKSLSKMLGIHF